MLLRSRCLQLQGLAKGLARSIWGAANRTRIWSTLTAPPGMGGAARVRLGEAESRPGRSLRCFGGEAGQSEQDQRQDHEREVEAPLHQTAGMAGVLTSGVYVGP